MRKSLVRDWARKAAGRFLGLSLGLLAGLALLATTVAAGTPPAATFSSAVNYAVGRNPHGVAVGDFNKDGHLDLAVANQADSTVTVLFGKGDGTFDTTKTVTLSVGTTPIAIAVGHFTASGNLDIVTANQNSNDVSVLLGNGDGTFQPAKSSPTGFIVPNALAAGDLNGDNKLDLVVSSLIGNNVVVLLGNGDGTFQPPTTVAVDSLPSAVVIADLNNDRKLDLAVATSSGFAGNVSILLGNGDGTFTPANPATVSVGPAPLALAAGDFNGDGKLDLVVANSNNTVSVLLGNGLGGFASAPRSPVSVGLSPSGIIVGDFNGDGLLDFVTANVGNNDASLVLGNGDGTFQPPVSLATDVNPVALAAGDFNGDHKLDLALANESSNDVSILLNATPAAGGPPPPPPISVTITSPTSAPTIQQGQTVSITATVANDPANQGVTWSLTCSGGACGSVSPMSTASGTQTTYVAPASISGNLVVTVTATSVGDTSKTASIVVTVTPPPISVTITSPTSPPIIQQGQTVFITATVANDPAHAGVTWSAACSTSPCGSFNPTSTASGSPTTYRAPASVSGNLTVTVTATSVSDSTKSASLTITVTNTPPTAKANPPQTITCAGPNGAVVRLSGSGADTDGDPLSFTWLDQLGNRLPNVSVVNNVATVTLLVPLGTHPFTLVVNDGHGNVATSTTQVTVMQATPPSFSSVTLSPNVLWPPNNKLWPITAQFQVSDNCDPHPSIVLKISSNDSDDDMKDIQYGTDVRKFWLRARKADHGLARIYTVIYSATDAAGNQGMSKPAQVVVPHSQGHHDRDKDDHHGKHDKDDKHKH